jgi:hypothetical protein
VSNFGTGFPGFKAAIEMVTEALGGDHARAAVAHIFDEQLKRAVGARKGGRFPTYSSLTYTEATDLDFDRARHDALRALQRCYSIGEATAPWKGATLAIRPTMRVARLEGGDYSVIVAMMSERPEYCRRAQATVTKWHVWVTDDGLRLATGKDSTYLMNGKPTTRNAKSQSAATKSLQSIVEEFFGATLVKLA